MQLHLQMQQYYLPTRVHEGVCSCITIMRIAMQYDRPTTGFGAYPCTRSLNSKHEDDV